MGRPRKWMKIPIPKPIQKDEPEVPETHIPGTEETPWGGATGGEGGFDEALKGAGEEQEEEQKPQPEAGAQRPQEPVDPAEVEALINFCDMTTVLVCRAFSISRRVQWTKSLQDECMLSGGEKAQLAMTAPAAMPYIRKLMLHMDKLAAAAFFLSYSFMLAGRMSIIKDKAPKPPPKKEEDGNGRRREEPAPAPREAAFTPTFGAPVSNQ
jgi:hypothetical protein